MVRLLTAALLARTADCSCARAEHVCGKYLDETWGGRGPYACNDTWAAEQGYDACPPPETCDFALAQQGDDTCKPARCQESGCCNSTRDSKEAEQYGSDLCPPQILSFEQGIYLYAACSENEDLCPEPDLAPGFVADVNPCWTKRHEFVNWGVSAGGCFDCGVTGVPAPTPKPTMSNTPPPIPAFTPPPIPAFTLPPIPAWTPVPTTTKPPTPAPVRAPTSAPTRAAVREAALAAAAAAAAAARVEACRTLCIADPECLSFEIATEREQDYHGFNCCLEYTHAGDKKAPNLWLGLDDVDGKRCENRIRGWTTYQFSSRIDGVPCDHAEPGYTALNTAYAYTGACGKKIDVANEAWKDQPGRQKWLDDGCPPPNPHLWNFLMFLAFLVAFLWGFAACESSVLWGVKYPVRKKRLCCWVIVYYLLASALLWHLVIAPAVYWHEFSYLLGLVGCCIGLVCGCACSALCTADAVYRATYLDVPAPAGEGEDEPADEAAGEVATGRELKGLPVWFGDHGGAVVIGEVMPEAPPEAPPSGVQEQSSGLLTPGTAAALGGALAVETRRAAAAEAVAGEVVTGEVPGEPVHAGETGRVDLADWQRSWGT